MSRGRRRHCPTPTTRYERPTLSPEFFNESINRQLITAVYGTFVRLHVVRDSNDSYPPPEPSPSWSAAEARTKCPGIDWPCSTFSAKEDQARRPRRPTRRLRRPSIEADSRLEKTSGSGLSRLSPASSCGSYPHALWCLRTGRPRKVSSTTPRHVDPVDPLPPPPSGFRSPADQPARTRCRPAAASSTPPRRPLAGPPLPS